MPGEGTSIGKGRLDFGGRSEESGIMSRCSDGGYRFQWAALVIAGRARAIAEEPGGAAVSYREEENG